MKILGDQVVACTLRGAQTDPHNADCSLTCLATRTADGLALVLVNRLDATRRVLTWEFSDGAYDIVSTTTLTAASDTARNTEYERQILVTTSTAVQPASGTLVLPARAVVGLRLRRR